MLKQLVSDKTANFSVSAMQAGSALCKSSLKPMRHASRPQTCEILVKHHRAMLLSKTKYASSLFSRHARGITPNNVGRSACSVDMLWALSRV